MTLLDGDLPALEIPAPICSHCRETVEMEGGGARCRGCRVSWMNVEDGEGSEPDEYVEGSDVKCEVERSQTSETYVYRGHNVRLDYKPCILPSGHETKQHLWPYDYQTTPIAEEAAA